MAAAEAVAEARTVARAQEDMAQEDMDVEDMDVEDMDVAVAVVDIKLIRKA